MVGIDRVVLVAIVGGPIYGGVVVIVIVILLILGCAGRFISLGYALIGLP